jgi:hypothetical protein
MVRCAAVADLLAHDLSKPVGETELTEYVATNHIKAEYERLFSTMTAALKSPDEVVGIWISGPPGSGKSSFVKNLGYVLGDRDSYEIFPVNLRAELAVETHAEHIAEAMYRALLRGLDYAEDYDISELEIELEKEGKLASFQDLCRVEYKKEWRDIEVCVRQLVAAPVGPSHLRFDGHLVERDSGSAFQEAECQGFG